MPAITPIQKAALDAIDTLHFNQIVMGLMCREHIATWYLQILQRINLKLSGAGITGKQAEIAKHYLLGALEIFLSFDKRMFEQVEYSFECDGSGKETNHSKKDVERYFKTVRNLSIGMHLRCARYNGMNIQFLTQIVDDLVSDKKLDLSAMPYAIRYRLTEYCYVVEYPDAPLSFYRELVHHGVISCGKYSNANDLYAKNDGSEISMLLIRAGLIFEFKMMQRLQSVMITNQGNEAINLPIPNSTMSRVERECIAGHYKQLVDLYVLDGTGSTSAIFQCKEHISKIHIERLLKNMSKFYFHKRMFCGTQGSWLGTLGAYAILARKIENQGEAIYCYENNGNTISERIRLEIKVFGFSMSSNNLYRRYKSIKKSTYPKVDYYHSMLLTKDFLVPWHLDKNDIYEKALNYVEK